MKKLFKIFIIFFIINISIVFSFVGWLGYNLIAPTLKGTDVSFFEFVKGDFDQETYEILKERMSNQASTLGDKTGAKFVDALGVLFPDPDFSYADLPPINYPYSSVDEVIESNDKLAREGIKKALGELKSNEDAIQKAKKEGLRILEESK